MKGIDVFVYSTTLDPAKHKKVGDGEDRSRRARSRAEGQSRARTSGCSAAARCSARCSTAGVVDTVEPAVCPILLGGGIPLLPTPAAQARLTLTAHKVYKASGIVLLEYAVSR